MYLVGSRGMNCGGERMNIWRLASYRTSMDVRTGQQTVGLGSGTGLTATASSAKPGATSTTLGGSGNAPVEAFRVLDWKVIR